MQDDFHDDSQENKGGKVVFEQLILETLARGTLKNVTECENDSDLTRYLHVLRSL